MGKAPDLSKVDPIPDLFGGDSFTLYPVRGIRRKNVGEFLLHALHGGEHERFALSLVPQNPIEKAHFDEWQGFVQQHELLLFEVLAVHSSQASIR